MGRRVLLIVAAGGLLAFSVGAWALGDPGATSVHASDIAVMHVADDADFAAAHEAWLQAPAYEGGRTACRRCHLREYRSWQRTPHANAYETLPEENRSDPDCVKCHVTGYGDDSGFKSLEETPNLAGVTCEVCHGPGTVYKDEDTMKSRDASVAAGLLLPDEQTCLGCHNSESPNFPGEFNFEEMKAAGLHDMKQQ